MDCIFCRIIAGEVASEVIYSDDQAIAIQDINPKAPVHLLIFPRKHIPTASDLTLEDQALAGHLMLVAVELARRHGVDESGYRMVINCRQDGGQVVPHIHLHLLGGRQLGKMG